MEPVSKIEIAFCVLVFLSSILLWLVFMFNLLGMTAIAFWLALVEVLVCIAFGLLIIRAVIRWK
jgi:hypothetical protein